MNAPPQSFLAHPSPSPSSSPRTIIVHHLPCPISQQDDWDEYVESPGGRKQAEDTTQGYIFEPSRPPGPEAQGPGGPGPAVPARPRPFPIIPPGPEARGPGGSGGGGPVGPPRGRMIILIILAPRTGL